MMCLENTCLRVSPPMVIIYKRAKNVSVFRSQDRNARYPLRARCGISPLPTTSVSSHGGVGSTGQSNQPVSTLQTESVSTRTATVHLKDHGTFINFNHE